MSWRNVATIAAKDLRIVITKRSIRLSVVLFPLVVAVGLPLVLRYGGRARGGIPATALPQLLQAFTFIFVVGAAILPTAIASYSLVGEKVERSLEPLLATPATDGEILLGKSIAAFLPPVTAIWAGAAVFMALSDQLTHSKLGYLYFPTATTLLIVLAVVPLAAILSVEYSVLVSARVSDVRAAQQLGAIAVLPFGGIYVAGEIGAFTLDGAALGIIAGSLAAVDVVLFVASRATFRREEILTRWT
jgi:ABC-2 type transport system permease protein